MIGLRSFSFLHYIQYKALLIVELRHGHLLEEPEIGNIRTYAIIFRENDFTKKTCAKLEMILDLNVNLKIFVIYIVYFKSRHALSRYYNFFDQIRIKLNLPFSDFVNLICFQPT